MQRVMAKVEGEQALAVRDGWQATAGVGAGQVSHGHK
jgi:hypothetical protein